MYDLTTGFAALSALGIVLLINKNVCDSKNWFLEVKNSRFKSKPVGLWSNFKWWTMWGFELLIPLWLSFWGIIFIAGLCITAALRSEVTTFLDSGNLNMASHNVFIVYGLVFSTASILAHSQILKVETETTDIKSESSVALKAIYVVSIINFFIMMSGFSFSFVAISSTILTIYATVSVKKIYQWIIVLPIAIAIVVIFSFLMISPSMRLFFRL